MTADERRIVTRFGRGGLIDVYLSALIGPGWRVTYLTYTPAPEEPREDTP